MTEIYLHVGTRKSGTTYLQQALSNTAEELPGHGVRLAYHSRRRHVSALLEPLHRARDGETADAVRAVERLAAQAGEHADARHVVTLEDLAELPQHVVDLVLDGLTGLDVHVVVTARPWRRIIPSEWQQDLKAGHTGSYADFLQAIRERSAGAAWFVARQDLPDIARRWGARLEPGRVHVLAVPPATRTSGSLLELFCGVIGLEPGMLRLPDRIVNSSMSMPQAELLRRVNVALGEWRTDREAYRRGVRSWLTRGALLKHPRGRIEVPAAYATWCAAEERRQLKELRALGVDLVGDPIDLTPPPAADLAGPGDPAASGGPAEVADIGAAVLADLAVAHWAELAERRVELQRIRAQRDELLAELERASGRRSRLPGRRR